MKFCIHDWETLMRGPKTLRAKIFQDELGIVIPTIFYTFCVFFGIYPIIFGLPLLGVGIMGSFIILTFVHLFYAIHIHDHNLDPWKSVDKACIKCGAMKFDATRAQKIRQRNELIAVNKKAQEEKVQRAREYVRQKKIEQMKPRYERMRKLVI